MQNLNTFRARYAACKLWEEKLCYLKIIHRTNDITRVDAVFFLEQSKVQLLIMQEIRRIRLEYYLKDNFLAILMVSNNSFVLIDLVNFASCLRVFIRNLCSCCFQADIHICFHQWQGGDCFTSECVGDN